MNTPQHVTVKQYLVLASAWLDSHAEPMPDGGVNCKRCGMPIRVAAVEMSILIEDSVDKGADLSHVFSVPLPGCPACEGVPNDACRHDSAVSYDRESAPPWADSPDKNRLVEAAAENALSLQSWVWIGLPSSTIRSEPA